MPLRKRGFLRRILGPRSGAKYRLSIPINPLLPMSIYDGVGWNRLDNGRLAVLFLIFAAMALMLAVTGLYAVIMRWVEQRTSEIGIRMAIGATRRTTLGLVFREGMFPVGIGLIAGLIMSLGVNRLVRAQLTDVSPSDPLTLAAAAFVLIATGALGCLIPARRAMRVDPAVALRHE